MTDSAEPAPSAPVTSAPASASASPAPVEGRAFPRLGPASLVRVEDLLLAVWIALAAPLLVRSGSLQPFETDRPFEGVLILASVAAAIVCVVTPASDRDRGQPVIGGAVGPLSGGLLLVTFTGFSALSAPSSWTLPIVAAAVVVIALIRIRYRVLPAIARRALVTPFVLVSGGLFWGLIDAVVGPEGASGVTASQLKDALLGGAGGAGAVGLTLLAFSAVYYAMLIYSPRRVADGEGSALAWLARYGLFVVSVLFGLGWVNAIGF
jgi:hypothetical protein